MISNSEYDLPQLCGFIVNELEEDVPSDWMTLILEANIFYEDEKQAISTVTYYTIDKSTIPKRFVASNAIGIMNAVLKINKVMSSNEKKWVNAEFVFNRDGMVNIDTDM